MKPDEIMKALEWYEDILPRKALEAAAADPQAIIPELLKTLRYTIDNFDKLFLDDDYMAHMYALYLLAQFREVRAYPLMMELFSIPGEAILDFTGDIITEDLQRIFAAVYGGDLEPIKALIENPNVNKYVRSAGLHTFVMLVAQGELPRDVAITYFKRLFREMLPRNDDFIWSSLVACSGDLYPDELYEDIKQAFADDLIDPMFIGLKDVEYTLKQGKDETLHEQQLDRLNQPIESTIAEMEKWHGFRLPEPGKLEQLETGQVVRAGKKIGRNEPCPCGSGLKYKRCHGKKG